MNASATAKIDEAAEEYDPLDVSAKHVEVLKGVCPCSQA
jgi:hypothetical protein